MEILGRQLRQIGAHLSGLSTSQRVALGLCLVLLVVGLGWLLQWAARPDVVALLNQPMKPEEIAAIERQLQAVGADYRLAGGQILVPPADRTRLFGLVAQSGSMPTDTSIGFSKLIEEANLWLPREESRWQRKIALGNELAKVLAQFDGVAEARVFIDQPERRGFGEAASGPTASVYLKTRPNVALDKARVAAIASLVSGAVHELKPEAVRIVDATTGRPYRVPAEDEALPFDLLDLRRQKEDHVGRKILAQLSYIPGVLVGVNAEIDLDRRREHVEKFGAPVVSEEQSVTSESQGGPVAAAPGVRPNTRAGTAGSAASESSNSEESHTTLLGERDKTITDTVSAPGVLRRVTASINVPRGYFVAIFRQLNANKEPQPKELEALFAEEEKKIRAQVKPLIAATNEQQVEVSWYYDASAVAPEAAAGTSQPTALTSVAAAYARPVGLGVLAVLCVLMVWQAARRASSAMVAPESTSGVSAVSGGDRRGRPGGAEAIAARRSASPGLPELGANVQRVEELVAQITKLVDEEPALAASIVDRWVSQPR